MSEKHSNNLTNLFKMSTYRLITVLVWNLSWVWQTYTLVSNLGTGSPTCGRAIYPFDAPCRHMGYSYKASCARRG